MSNAPTADSRPDNSAEVIALDKQKHLFSSLGRIDSLVVAFSGGADSAYLAWAAHQVLGPRALAVTAISPSFSAYDREQALAFADRVGLRHECIETHEFENPLYVANNGDRCYHCKDELFVRMEALASAHGFAAIAYGINADDTRDFRPGHRAAAEHQVLTPLLDAGLTKAEIRSLSRRVGLATWDRPASACLSSRIPYGTAVTPDLLRRVEECEAILRELGFRQFRVRAHGDLARIEIAPEELQRALNPQMAYEFASRFKTLGFSYVTLDLEGYRQGALNATLGKK